MTLPRKLSPNPLITSTVEIRFSSTIIEEDVLNVFYPAFSKEFPKIKEGARIPKEIKNKAEFKHLADYILVNDDYSLSIGANSVSFENIGTYHLWENYSQMINSNLSILADLKISKEITRIGVRYASIFEKKDSITEYLKVNFGLSFNDYHQDIQSLRTEFKRGDIKLLVQIAKNAKYEKVDASENISIEGLYIDIDASSDTKLPTNFGEEVFKIIEELHREQKSLLFEHIMKPEFLASLNPQF